MPLSRNGGAKLRFLFVLASAGLPFSAEYYSFTCMDAFTR